MQYMVVKVIRNPKCRPSTYAAEQNIYTISDRKKIYFVCLIIHIFPYLCNIIIHIRTFLE
jgi:hypothetical protein